MHTEMIVGFIGGGNMAKAIAGGILKKGLVQSSQIIVSAPSETTSDYWRSLSIETTQSNAEIVNRADIVILAFKPQQLENALKDIALDLHSSLPPKLFISVLAGIPCKVLYSTITEHVQRSAKLVRVMPNTLTAICEGCSAVAPHASASLDDIKIVTEIFTALGQCEVVPEYLIPAFTGLSGSGPAYIYMIIEALSDGGVKQGLPRDLSTAFAAQTVLGAAKMVLETKKHPSQLKDEVCSAGGTTIYAIHALEKGGLRATLMNALEAAATRGIEIGKLSMQ